MPIQTTCNGAYTKPDYIKKANWREVVAQNMGIGAVQQSEIDHDI